MYLLWRNPWDGPHSLIDMLEIPDAFKPLISDYKFNLIELRKSESLKFSQRRCQHNIQY